MKLEYIKIFYINYFKWDGSMLIDISNKVVVITGASKGIGRSLAKKFAEEKAKIVINYYHSERDAYELYNEIIQFNKQCLLIKADVTNATDVKRFYHETIKCFDHIDVLINNAGICDDNPIHLMPYEQWERVINVNLSGPFICSKEFSKAMLQQKKGKIINIASLKGQEGCAGQVNYSSSKAGLIGFTKALAKELGQYNIAVNAVCPGFIVTDLNRHDIKKQCIAMQRSILPHKDQLSNLINFIVFMASDLFDGASGQIYNIDSRII